MSVEYTLGVLMSVEYTLGVLMSVECTLGVLMSVECTLGVLMSVLHCCHTARVLQVKTSWRLLLVKLLDQRYTKP